MNDWTRSSTVFDAVVGFDATVRDAKNGSMSDPRHDVGGYLHLNPEGYGVTAQKVDLGAF